MQTKLEHVPLKQIRVSDTNEMFRDESEMTEEALQELIASIKASGVIQPVLLRAPSNDSKQPYTLICGERRFRASGFAGLETIPANIRVMTDEEAFECQVTENLQRKDVHPLKEAKAYKYLVDKDPATYTAKELALKFGKSEHYILTRLKLNDLVPEVRKDYLANKMSLAAALAIARLDPEAQREVKEEQYSDQYESADEIEDFIQRSIMCNLKEAPFKKDDVTLNPSMGACTTCQFRTGANQLFADVKEKDRCLNRACFNIKKSAHTIRTLNDIITNKPDILLLRNRDLSPEIEKFLKEKGLKSLKEYTDFHEYDNGGVKAKGYWLNGYDEGKFVTVYIPKHKSGKVIEAKAGAASSDEEIKLQNDIARIEEKISKDQSKADDVIFKKVIESLRIHEHQTTVNSNITKSEDVLIMFHMYQSLQYDVMDQDGDKFKPEWKKLKLPVFDEAEMGDEKDWEKLYKALSQLTFAQKTFMCRQYLDLKFYQNKHMGSDSMEAYFIRRAAEDLGVPVADIRKEQEDLREASEAKARARIAVLEEELKELRKQVKDTKPKAKKKKAEPVEA